MVQRKVTNKLAIQADHLKTENQDVKNGGMDLKKMKKSASFKRPEFDILRASNVKGHVKQPGNSPEGATTPQKQTLPNYMKSTSSSDARKEKTPVSIKTPQNSLGKKEIKTFARSISLKMTSIPSFKPARAKKCTPVALCENLDNVQRATCSSTMKDCKFPSYLALSPGGTESEGTSAMKVCPYTYCSLNGHHHPPLPPLKGFMSARRRMLKTQRSVKLGCLSPRLKRTPEDILKFEGPTIRPPIQEEQGDFFIEIYTADKDAAADVEDHNHEENKEAKITEEDSPTSLAKEKTRHGILSAQFCELDSEASDVDWETGQYSALHLDDDYEYPSKIEKEADLEGGVVENCVLEDNFMIKLDDNMNNCFNEFPADEVSQESFDEESLSSGAWPSSDDSESIDSYNYPDNLETSAITRPQIGNTAEEETLSDNLKDDQASAKEKVTSADECQSGNTETKDVLEEKSNQDEDFKISSTMSPAKESHLKLEGLDNAAKPETEDNTLNRVPVTCKKPTQDSDELGDFNPRAPNFLLLEPDPDAENVDLRHQELDERKNAEEWMVDYALRQVVAKLGPARKKKVSLLIEAFQKVMPVTNYDIHLKNNSAFDHARPIQACS